MPALDSKIELLPRLTKPQIAALKKLGVETVRDLLFYFPYRYLDFSQVKTIKELHSGESVSIKATIKQINSRFSFRSRLNMAEAVVSDETGSMKVVWFNQGYLAKTLNKGDEVFLAGTPEYYNHSLQLTNPLHEKVSDFPVHTARLVPVYHLTSDLYHKTLRNIIAQVIHLGTEAEESLPADILKNQKLLTIPETIRFSHFPESPDQAQSAKRRLAFEEIFLNQLLAQQYKISLLQKQSFAIPFDLELVKNFLATLPFELTPGQKKAAWDVLQDMEKPVPMNRLIEGDVGSGKTLVALIAALGAIDGNLQVALLTPTEILARQHYSTFLALIPKFHGREISVCLRTNHYALVGNEESSKKKLDTLIAEGMPGIFIGTHALLSEKIKFKNLSLVIIDEQHRFGVEQRAALIRDSIKVPHLLSLTATPIPRTLQLAYYGELDISQIKSKPANRKPIITKLVTKADRHKAYDFIQKQVAEGRQAFVITPLVEESETLDVKSAKTEYENLQKVFPRFAIGLLHGKMKGADKERTMAEFASNKIQILVATSVVEVGVDVPNAAVMLIEGAERFGLAQLHQFRGRVGRAEHQSYCFLFTENENAEIIERLKNFTKTQDGFALAELDLQTRGFGELYGSDQSGWNFKYFSPAYASLIEPAREEAKQLLADDFELVKHPYLKAKIKNQVIHFE